MTASATDVLFTPLVIGRLSLPNRIVMAPMTRSFSPEGVPGEDVAAYYRRRAEGGVGLIITEGTYPPHPSSGFDPNVPHVYGEAALAGWRRVTSEVHATGGKIFCQLWHVGMQVSSGPPPSEDGPKPVGPAMSEHEIADVIEAFAAGAVNAQAAGFDGIELHGAHGYLIDQFFWERTNRRTDAWGGDLVRRTRFAAEIIKAVRRRVGEAFPISLRLSQWKIDDYAAKLAATPEELARFLEPLNGVDAFHCSTRRFWEPEFEGSDLGFAGWTRKLTGKPVIAVGSVTLGADVMETFRTVETAAATGVENVIERMSRGEFDLIAVGRSLLANPNWARIVKSGGTDQLRPFTRDVLATLV